MKLQWPLTGHEEASISQGFGPMGLDYAQFGLLGHNGLDFPANLGTPIHAAFEGWIVEQVAKDTGFGLRITQRIEADGRSWLLIYGHMERLQDPTTFAYDFNFKGRHVYAGDVIGYVDSTGFSTGNHLHLGLYPMNEDGTYVLKTNGFGGAVDPLPYLKGDFMVYFAHVSGTQEYGFVEETPFTKVYNRGVNENDIKFMAAKFGLNVTKDDGSIDFSRAKDISI